MRFKAERDVNLDDLDEILVFAVGCFSSKKNPFPASFAEFWEGFGEDGKRGDWVGEEGKSYEEDAKVL